MQAFCLGVREQTALHITKAFVSSLMGSLGKNVYTYAAQFKILKWKPEHTSVLCSWLFTLLLTQVLYKL